MAVCHAGVVRAARFGLASDYLATANDDTVWGYAVRPAGSMGKLPIAYMVHGGPQGSSNNSWSYRWNPAVFAGAGYALGAVDFIAKPFLPRDLLATIREVLEHVDG